MLEDEDTFSSASSMNRSSTQSGRLSCCSAAAVATPAAPAALGSSIATGAETQTLLQSSPHVVIAHSLASVAAAIQAGAADWSPPGVSGQAGAAGQRHHPIGQRRHRHAQRRAIIGSSSTRSRVAYVSSCRVGQV